MVETLDIIAKLIINEKYKNVKSKDFTKKQEKSAIMHILMKHSK